MTHTHVHATRKTWEKQLTSTDFYFNGIHCFDEDTCTAVGEGFGDSPKPGGYPPRIPSVNTLLP